MSRGVSSGGHEWNFVILGMKLLEKLFVIDVKGTLTEGEIVIDF